MTNSQDNEKTKFYVDTNPSTFKWGVKLRPLVFNGQSIFIGKNEEHIGIKKLSLNPWFLAGIIGWVTHSVVGIALGNKWANSNYDKKIDFDPKLFENIPFQDIKTLSSHKLIGGDLVIDLIYNKDSNQKKISFFAANEINNRSKDTLKILNLLKSKTNL